MITVMLAGGRPVRGDRGPARGLPRRAEHPAVHGGADGGGPSDLATAAGGRLPRLLRRGLRVHACGAQADRLAVHAARRDRGGLSAGPDPDRAAHPLGGQYRRPVRGHPERRLPLRRLWAGARRRAARRHRRGTWPFALLFAGLVLFAVSGWAAARPRFADDATSAEELAPCQRMSSRMCSPASTAAGRIAPEWGCPPCRPGTSPRPGHHRARRRRPGRSCRCAASSPDR